MRYTTNYLTAAKEEFKEIISTYLFPLFDVKGSIKYKNNTRSINNSLVVFEEAANGNKILKFYPCLGTPEHPAPFYCEIGTYSSKGIKGRLEMILRELMKVAEFSCHNGKIRKQRDYGTKKIRQETYKKRTLNIAFELGMCHSLIGTYENATTLHSILDCMIEWAGRTYEGKNVPFGIIIDFDIEASEDTVSYLHFLQNDSSAVFTDGIFSGILLDKSGKLVSFITRDTKPANTDSGKDLFVPYQFLDIAKHCNGNAIGIIVLTNGEILLIKGRAIAFAKRGSKWISFDWERIYTNLRPYFLLGTDQNEESISRKIKSIYCTLLDVSFSHTGGCLSIVIPNINDGEISKVIRDRFDLSVTGDTPQNISAESKEKIEVLKYLLISPEHSIKSFFEVDKPLRKEILSLDGATVVSLDGSFYCAGSIVAVPGGSSGGGRTAATKRLAQFGVGIKISEDGYIEAYGAPIDESDEDTPRIVPLFKIK